MEDDKMDDVLKKLCLSAHRARFIEEKILTNIICYLSVEDFLKLEFTDRNAVMSLRNQCSTLSWCTTQRAVRTNKFVIINVLIKIDDGFSVKQMSNILCVSQRTVLRRMVV